MKWTSNLKRCVAAVLTVAMLLSNTPVVGVYAETADTSAGVETVGQTVTEPTEETVVTEPTEETEATEPTEETEATEPTEETEATEPTEETEATEPGGDTWSGMTDGEFALSIMGGEHDEEIPAMSQTSDEMYEAFCVTEYLTSLAGGTETEPVNVDDPAFIADAAFGKLYQQVFGKAIHDGDYQVIYVAGSTKPEASGDDGTIKKPFVSIKDALNSVSNDTCVIIYIQNAYEYETEAYSAYDGSTDFQNGWLDIHPGEYSYGKPFVIVGQGTAAENANIPMLNDWEITSNVGFYDIGISLKYSKATFKSIFCNGNDVVFGGEGKNNFSVTPSVTGAYYPVLFGGGLNLNITSTDLTVNGGTWGAIFGGGAGNSTINKVNLTINGKIGAGTEDGSSSVKLFVPGNIATVYTNANKSAGCIYGGGATYYANKTTATAENISLKISYLAYHQSGTTFTGNESYTVYVVSGNSVDIDADGDGQYSLEMDHSTVKNVSRVDLNFYNISYNIDHSRVESVNAGATAGTQIPRTYTVVATDSVIVSYKGTRESWGYGYRNIVQNTDYASFTGCRIKNICASYTYDMLRASGCTRSTSNTIILDNCTVSGCVFAPEGDTASLTIKNSPVPVVYLDDIESGKNHNNAGELAVYQDNNWHTLDLIFDNSDVTMDLGAEKEVNSLTLSNGTFVRARTLKIGTLKQTGGVSTVALGETSKIALSSLSIESPIQVTNWGTIADGKCATIVLNGNWEQGSFVRAADAQNGFGYESSASITNWYLGTAPDRSKYIYVDARYAGDDSDGTFSKPFKTLAAAGACAKVNENLVRNSIVLLSVYTLAQEENLPASNCPIELTAKDAFNDYASNAYLDFSGLAAKSTVKFMADTNVHDIYFYDTYSEPSEYIYIAANSKKITIGSNVTMPTTDWHSKSRGFALVGVVNGETVEKVDITVGSGAWYWIGNGSGKVGDENNITRESIVNIKFTDSFAYQRLFLESGCTVYGGMDLDILCRKRVTGDGWFRYSFSGTYHGPVNISVSGSEVFTLDSYIGGTYYKPFVFNSYCDSTVYAKPRFSGAAFYDDAVFNEAYGKDSVILTNVFVAEGKTLTINAKSSALSVNATTLLALSSQGTVIVNCENGLSSVTCKAGAEYAKNITVNLNHHSSMNMAVSMGETGILPNFVFGTDSVVTATSDAKFCSMIFGQNAGYYGTNLTVGFADNPYALSMETGSFISLQELLHVEGNAAFAADGTTLLYMDGTPGDTPETQNSITGTVSGTMVLKTSRIYDPEKLPECQILYLTEGTDGVTVVGATDAITVDTTSDSGGCKVYYGDKKREYVYVNGDSGSDDFDGISQTTAVKTLQKAYELVCNGGYIIVTGNTDTSAAWPQVYKGAHITAYDVQPYEVGHTPEKIDFSNDVTLTAPGTITLYGALNLECLTLSGTKAVKACGYPVTFGVQSLPSADTKNFTNSTAISVTGLNSVQGASHITIHSGSFGQVNPLMNEGYVDYTQYPGDANGVVAYVTMTGGTVSSTGVPSRTNISGKRMIFNLSGGTWKSLGLPIDQFPTNTNTEISYNISGSFTFESLYYTHEQGESKSTGSKVTVNIDGSGVHAGTIICGNSSRYNPACSFEITLRNGAVVEKIVGNVYDYDAVYNTAEIHLYDNSQIRNLYLGGSRNGSNTGAYAYKQLDVFFYDDAAFIENIYNHGPGNISQAQECNIINAVDGYYAPGFLEQMDVDANCSTRPNYVIKTGSSSVITAAMEQNIRNLTVEPNAAVFLRKSASIAGDFIGSENQDAKSTLLVEAGSVVNIGGQASGYTDVVAGKPSEDEESTLFGLKYKADPNAFDSGLTIKARAGAEQCFTESYADIELLYDNNESGSIWFIKDKSDTLYRNKIYVSSGGTDATSGTMSSPVSTLAAAYIRAGERYAQLKQYVQQIDKITASEEVMALKTEIQESYAAGIQIVLLDRIVIGDMSSVTLTNEALNHHPICITTENGEGTILFGVNTKELSIPVNTAIQKVTLYSIVNSPVIYANGNEVKIEKTVETDAEASGMQGFEIYGGSKSSNVNGTHVTVLGGEWAQIYGGNYAGTVDGNVNLTVDTNAENVHGASFNGIVSGDVYLTIDGGSYQRVAGGGYLQAVTNTIHLDFNHGSINKLYGGGDNTAATAKSAIITIGNDGPDGGEATVVSIFRGAGERGGYTEIGTIILGEDCVMGQESQEVDLCCAGYAGTVANVEVQVNGGLVYGNLYLGGAGETTSDSYGIVTLSTSLVMNGGTIHGSIFGGGNNGLVNGTTNLQVNGGTITGDIYGGGNAAGVLASSVTVKGGDITGDIYGGSYKITRKEPGQRDIQTTSEIIVAGNENNVYGGSNLSGNISSSTNISVPAGKTATATIYGGGNQAEITGQATVAVNGTLKGTVFGGGKGVVDNGVLIDANAANTVVTINGTVTGNVYGGGELATVGISDGTATVTNVTLNTGATVIGNVYGGGKGDADHAEYAKINGSTAVNLNGGTVQVTENSESAATGSVFGGGEIAPVAGNTSVTVTSGSFSNIFGGNDVKGEITGTASVIIPSNSTTTVAHVYGGGRNASCETSSVSVASGSHAEITDIFGGGYGISANTNHASVSVAGSKVDHVYGGGNAAPTANASTTVSGGTITSAFGGGNAASTKNAKITLTGGTLDSLFAGGNEATVTGTATLELATGKGNKCVKTIYSGNNIADMAIAPTVKFTSGSADTFYGGGNQGSMTRAEGIAYRFESADVAIDTVYGGSYATGEKAGVAGGVTMTFTKGSFGEIYGGNNESGKAVKTTITLYEAAGDTLTVGTVYGGGNKAPADVTNVILKNGSVTTAIYGGGNAAEAETTNVTVEGGSVPQVFGGGYGETAITQTTNVTIKSADADVLPEVFGGGNAGAVTTTNVTVESGFVTKLYGGGNMAPADTTHITVTGGKIGDFSAEATDVGGIFGGGNLGVVETATHVAVNGGQVTAVYGGGNKAAAKETSVTIGETATVNNTYGGGLEGAADMTHVMLAGGTIQDNIYGGGFKGPVLVSTEVKAQYGTVEGNIYGGGYAGLVGTTSALGNGNGMTVVILEDPEGKILTVKGSVFGGGEGTTASVLGYSDVSINLNYDFTAIENPITSETNEGANSGAITTEITEGTGPYSVIEGNVYGGGDLGQMGAGSINISANTASVSCTGGTHVTVTNGHIKGSVFGGGSGVPTEETGFVVSMGAVYGSTLTDIKGGFIEKNIYGGGTQSRLYQSGDRNNGLAAQVNVTNGIHKLAIDGSVFGGGDRGSGNATNASVPTTVGNVEVNIVGAEAATTMYFASGGVYGDGNLCLVNGNRTINVTNLQTNSANTLKTFYSLQRADTVNLKNSHIVLLGAVDLVEVGDSTVYSINRVGCLNMKEGSIVKLDQIVKYLAALTSDKNTDTVYVDKGNNGSNSYTKRGGEDPAGKLTDEAIDTYRERETNKNVICVANGRYLEISNDRGEYGPITGLFTLQLLRANPGEGGGFVYGNIDTSIGDFICETRSDTGYKLAENITADNFSQGTYYIRNSAVSFVRATEFRGGEVYYTRNEGTANYMHVVDNVGGYVGGDYTYYYWYISGAVIQYSVNLTGYIGSEYSSFPEETMTPTHKDTPLAYVLYGISINPALEQAVYGDTKVYDLKQSASGLTDQEIAIEVKLGDVSLGFLGVEEDSGVVRPYIKNGEKKFYGYDGQTGLVSMNRLAENFVATDMNNKVTFILHKSTGVNAEMKDMGLQLDMDLYISNSLDVYGGGTRTLSFYTNISILRLVPEQEMYHNSAKEYAGVSVTTDIFITGNSAFTTEYQTKYIPSAFPKSGTMEWMLSVKPYYYYFCESTGEYFTLDEDKKLINKSSAFNLQTGIGTEPSEKNAMTIYSETEGTETRYYYYALVGGESDSRVYFKLMNPTTVDTQIPKFTKITMIDYSGETPLYYYYNCAVGAAEEIDLHHFMEMGTNKTISELIAAGKTPAFIQGYDNQATARFTERLVFVVDYAQVNLGSVGQYTGEMNLRHAYNGVDILDYVRAETKTLEDGSKTTVYSRSWPKATTFNVNTNTNGLDRQSVELRDGIHLDRGTLTLRVGFKEHDTWTNTQLQEGSYSVRIELLQTDGTIVDFPTGISFEMNGETYSPGITNQYAVIPVDTVPPSGYWEIQIRNPLFGYKSVLEENATQAKFRITLFSAPDARYYNVSEIFQSADIQFTIQNNPQYDLEISTGNIGMSQILYKDGEGLTFGYRTESNPDPAPKVMVSAFAKTADGAYSSQDVLDVLFPGAQNLNPNATQQWVTWELGTNAAAGTYRLVFQFGDQIEYLNLVVLER